MILCQEQMIAICVRAEEIWIKVAGKQKYLFASMDDQTRYWLASDMADTKFQYNADMLLEMTKKTIGKDPKHFITDVVASIYEIIT